MSLLRTYRWSFLITVLAVIVAYIYLGIEGALAASLLIVLEISLSFDNAIVNATVLQGMSEKWRRAFLTWGVLIAVFGMRLVFPIVIVAVAGGLGVGTVLDMALNDPDQYSKELNDAYPAIAAFGGTFLLLVFLSFILDPERDLHWLAPVERALGKIGKLDSVAIVIAATALLGLSQVVDENLQSTVLVSGVAAIIIYVLTSSLAELLDGARQRKLTTDVAIGGGASFLYLEVLDASFSFDGVIGAFAISTNVVIIALGLGVGAFYVRSMTIHLVNAGTLRQYVFLEHGAHWAIGILAVILLVGVQWHVNEIFTGLFGVGVIVAALVSSLVYNRRNPDRDDEATPDTLKTPDPLHAAD